MRAALLVCDHVPPDLGEKHGHYPEMYQQFFSDLILAPFYVCDHHFPPLSDYDIFIITGSRYSVYDPEDWIHELKRFVREISEADKKCIGICFGHQMIAEALGGSVQKAPVGYLIGVHTFSIRGRINWMAGEKKEYNVLMLCQDQVVELPAAAEILAGNALCPVGMYQIGSQFFAIQGHPEFTKSFNEDVFMSRREKIGVAKIMEAKLSFLKDPDRLWLQKIMMQFLQLEE